MSVRWRDEDGPCAECHCRQPEERHASWCSSQYETGRYTTPWAVVALVLAIIAVGFLQEIVR